MHATWLLQVESEGFPVAAGLFAVALAFVHLFSGQWPVATPVHRRRWLSAAGGASVAYVFVLLLPEVSEAALVTGERVRRELLAEQVVYLLALGGFVTFYAVETVVVQRRGESAEDTPTVFWLHVGVFAVYSAVIGYLLFHQEVAGLWNVLLYAVAMALHFEVTDYGLRRHHGDEFDRVGRWVLAGGTLLGGVAGALTETVGPWLAMLFGFLAGAIVFNVIKEELPAVEESRFLAFLAGACVYTIVALFA
ncbi:hypothetical protein [Haloarcula marina]|uniref:hypothetical protein n=1 Tax=Haloarcula marina TaxID=2961574 RepID=UPI0020B866CA|nr:hypothetical protein [Halomicroarcula marina]